MPTMVLAPATTPAVPVQPAAPDAHSARRDRGHGGGNPASSGRPGVVLEDRTQLSDRPFWQVTAYPKVGEATITWRNPRPRDDREEIDRRLPEERHTQNRLRTVRRARSRARRYVVANRLRVMITLTYPEGSPGLHDRRRCMADARDFLALLRAEVGKMPSFYTAEQHSNDRGWHVHILIDRRVSRHVVARIWKHGTQVRVSDFSSHGQYRCLPYKDALILASDHAYGYCAKKWATTEIAAGDHLYEVAQGFTPKPVVRMAPTLQAAMAITRAFFRHRPPDSVWESSQAPYWDGPPAYVLRWTVGGNRQRGPTVDTEWSAWNRHHQQY